VLREYYSIIFNVQKCSLYPIKYGRYPWSISFCT
jgi:hypothetical protein